MSPKTVLATAGAGFIGSHLCEHLLARGSRVVCYDNFDSYYVPETKARNRSAIRRHRRFHLVRADILDARWLTDTMRTFDVDQVAHLAARAGGRAMELAAHTCHHLWSLPVGCLRLFTAYGPRQRPEMAIAWFADRIRRVVPIDMYGDGSSRRDYTFIHDLVHEIVAALDRARTLLNCAPRTGHYDGLRQYVAWLDAPQNSPVPSNSAPATSPH